MGYNTWYELTYEGEPELRRGVAKALEEISEGYIMPEDFIHKGGEERTWYDHEKHLVELSKTFTPHVFKLFYRGEEDEDIGYKYFLNGQIQYDPIRFVFDGFDPNKLEDFEE